MRIVSLLCIKNWIFQNCNSTNLIQQTDTRREARKAQWQMTNFRKKNRMHNFGYYPLFHRRKSSFFLERDAVEARAHHLTRFYLTCWFVYDKLSFSFSSSWSRVPRFKVLCQMYAHIYGRKHGRVSLPLCEYAEWQITLA